MFQCHKSEPQKCGVHGARVVHSQQHGGGKGAHGMRIRETHTAAGFTDSGNVGQSAWLAYGIDSVVAASVAVVPQILIGDMWQTVEGAQPVVGTGHNKVALPAGSAVRLALTGVGITSCGLAMLSH